LGFPTLDDALAGEQAYMDCGTKRKLADWEIERVKRVIAKEIKGMNPH